MTEQRLHPRVDYTTEFECRRFYDMAGNMNQFIPGAVFKVENLSPGGMQVLSEALLKSEAVPIFTLYLEQIPYSAMCRVRWRREAEDGYRYGLEFLTISNGLYNHLREVVAHELEKRPGS